MKTALAERLEREHLKRADAVSLMKTIEALLHDSDNLPVLDGRTVKEILGYDENGLPG